MPITGLTLITVTGKYLKIDGTAAAGSVTFTPSEVLLQPAANEVIYPYPFTVNLDGTGSFSIQLPSTNDPDLLPVGWTYKVKESITGSTESREFDIELPYTVSPVDMADIAAAVPVTQVGSYVLSSDDRLKKMVLTSTYFYVPPGAGSTGAMVSNRMYLTAIETNGGPLDRIGMGVTVAGTGGGVIRLGAYTALATGLPGALIAEAAATVSADAVQDTLAAMANITATLPVGRAFLAAAWQGGTGAPTVRTLSGSALTLPATSVIGLSLAGYYQDSVSGALPANSAAIAHGAGVARPQVRAA